jgi:hypothetical protein
MNFRQATDELIASLTLEDLATALGVSVQAVRQARAAKGSASHRPPPEGWERAVQRLAGVRGDQLMRLAKAL